MFFLLGARITRCGWVKGTFCYECRMNSDTSDRQHLHLIAAKVDRSHFIFEISFIESFGSSGETKNYLWIPHSDLPFAILISAIWHHSFSAKRKREKKILINWTTWFVLGCIKYWNEFGSDLGGEWVKEITIIIHISLIIHQKHSLNTQIRFHCSDDHLETTKQFFKIRMTSSNVTFCRNVLALLNKFSKSLYQKIVWFLHRLTNNRF